jgi:SNF2 family DNA or RNA helicase
LLGLEFHRQAAGSHEIWFNAGLNRYTTIPYWGFLSRLGLNACLADDMGLGKTVQVIPARPCSRS